jgi:putative two-component system response regulator
MDQPKRILVVDDEELNRRLLGTFLKRLGYETDEAGDGAEALEKVKAAPPDLILLDIQMPRLNGIEAARRLKADPASRLIPIVIVSSMSDLEPRVQALEAGVDDFLAKPVERTELRARVQSLLKVKAYNDHLLNYQKELEAAVAKRTEELRRAFDELKAASDKLRRASLDTIFRLSQAAEYKDEDTGNHIRRIGYYTAAIARQLGLPAEDVESILYAAPMHDIGKIGIPDRILLKPGKLDPEEWEIMKRHSEIGSELLKGSDSALIQMAETIALTHHEKWGGGGYPRNLQGDDIPLAGRITAIADVFDALTSKRPYKEPMPVDAALGIIRQSRGSHFDPAVVDAFFASQPEIVKIREGWADK